MIGILGMATHRNASRSSSSPETFGENGTPLPIARGIAGDLERWKISRSLQPDFKTTVRLCCVFGYKGSMALFVTRDDKVFALGNNADGCLGIGNTFECSSPVEVTALSGKDVQTFAYGREHVLALTGDGKVYGWGDNRFFQVGKAAPEKINTPTLVFEGAPVVEIACGTYHSVCRTRNGHVYCWGFNSRGQIGIDKIKQKLKPHKVQGLIANLMCTGISCLSCSTIAVFENGEVYAWGYNDFGLLGIKSNVKEQWVPGKIDFNNICIRKVASGLTHSLAVTETGSLYVWGYNNHGQLGLKHKLGQPTPIRHPAFTGTRIVEIAVTSAFISYTSAVMTDKSEVLMWGDGKDPEVVSDAVSVQDAFATSSENETPVPLIVESMPSDSPISAPVARDSSALPGWSVNTLNTIAEQFDDPRLSDVKFVVGGGTIHAHRTVLSFQSEYFRTMFEGPWTSRDSDPINVTESSYSVYKAFLRYFYTGEVDLPVTQTLELLNLANTCSEDVLKTLCERRMERMITIKNCASVYSTAVRCGAGFLEDLCSRFAGINLKAVLRTNALAELPEDILRRFLARATNGSRSYPSTDTAAGVQVPGPAAQRPGDTV